MNYLEKNDRSYLMEISSRNPDMKIIRLVWKGGMGCQFKKVCVYERFETAVLVVNTKEKMK